MRESLKCVCDNYVTNRDEIKKVFRLDNVAIHAAAASELCGNGVVTNEETLKECKKILEKHTGVLSNFNGNVRVPVVAMLAESDKPEEKLEKAKKIYDTLKESFSGSEYLALTAAILADMIEEEETEKYALRGKQVYDRMKKEHPFLTSKEDSVFAVLLAFSEKTDDELLDEMEACYTCSKKEFSDSNAVQSLTHVLTLGEGATEEKCKRVSDLYHGLEKAGKKYGKHYELAVLGSLALLQVEVDVLVEDILQVDEFLAEQKGYGILGMDKKTRLMHAAMLVSNDYAKENVANTSALASTLAMVAAQQAAVVCVMAASTAAATAAAN